MQVLLGIHATDPTIAERILATHFVPGRKVTSYLGEGVYFYGVHGDHGLQHAMDWAKRVSSGQRRYAGASFLIAQISVENALSLQHPLIQPWFDAFCDAFDRRRTELGLQVEENDNASYVRPTSYLAIEAFRHSVEAIGKRPIDVLSARFPLKRRDIYVEPPREICVKRARAILSVRPCRAGDKCASSRSDPARWPCPEEVAEAAQQAVRSIAAMDIQDFMDLIQSIYQGSDRSWDALRPRFRRPGPIVLLYDSRRHGEALPLARQVLRAACAKPKVLENVDLGELSLADQVGGRVRVERILDQASAIVALVGPKDVDVTPLLVTVAERRGDVPMLALLAAAGGPAALSTTSLTLRSRLNLTCVALPAKEGIAPLVRGFFHDRWTDGLESLAIERRMVARHGKPDRRRRDARRIVEAYHAGQHRLL
jgi:hypothetical protein